MVQNLNKVQNGSRSTGAKGNRTAQALQQLLTMLVLMPNACAITALGQRPAHAKCYSCLTFCHDLCLAGSHPESTKMGLGKKCHIPSILKANECPFISRVSPSTGCCATPQLACYSYPICFQQLKCSDLDELLEEGGGTKQVSILQY